MPELITEDQFEIYFIALFLEAFFYGLYSGIMTMYLQYWQESRKDTNTKQKIIFYSICALYVLSTAVFVCDILGESVTAIEVLSANLRVSALLRIDVIQNVSYACCDFIAQFILIYRCWIVWGRNIRVVIIPSILAFAFFAVWLASTDSVYILSDELVNSPWGPPLFLTSLALSLTVNVLVTGLIVFRIFKVFREVKAASVDDQILGVTGGSKLRRIIFMLIESGMALFSIQLIRLAVSMVETDAAIRAYNITVGIHEMLTGITPTIILVRTSMGLSYDDKKSMEEFAIESLRFGSNHPNSVPEMGSIGIVDENSRDDDIGVQRSNDIEVAER